VGGRRLHDGDYLATVGYGEIQPLGNRGRLFTIPNLDGRGQYWLYRQSLYKP